MSRDELVLRLRRSFLLAAFIGTFAWIMDWIGLDKKWNSIPEVKPFSEVWWHLPLWVAAFFVVDYFLRGRRPEDPDDTADPDSR